MLAEFWQIPTLGALSGEDNPQAWEEEGKLSL